MRCNTCVRGALLPGCHRSSRRCSFLLTPICMLSTPQQLLQNPVHVCVSAPMSPAGAGLPAEQQALQQPLLASTSAHLSQMSEAGYRTLVVASKPLQQQQYEAWAEQYKSACASMGDRNSQVAAVCEAMECDLTLLGATAVEDKLQVGVEVKSSCCRFVRLAGLLQFSCRTSCCW